MIPRQLTLKNFLSYRLATLDFRGLHVACICGANGAGKSSLLEAIAWTIWGESRATNEDDVIHQGETEVQVDFIFECHHQVYRVIRTRYRGQPSVLEFQIETSTGFRSLTERGMRATQQLILQHLKLDYETFINSAYLRQGRADEFMLKRPTDRKQILADLLHLDQYDALEEQAKERSRQLKAELTSLERQIETTDRQLLQAPELEAEQSHLTALLSTLQEQQQQDQETLRQWQQQQQQRQTWQQQLTLQQQQRHLLMQDCQRLQQEFTTVQQQQQKLEELFGETEAIAAGYAHFQQLQVEEEQQTAKFQAYQTAYGQRQALQQQQAEAIQFITDQIRQVNAQLEALQHQEQDINHTLSKAEQVGSALEHLHQARARLIELDNLQLKVSPLLQRRQQVYTQLERLQTRLSARLEELQTLAQTLYTQYQRQPKLQQAVIEVAERVDHLEKRRLYQQKVREKGLERRSFLERLQERQRDYERQLAAIDHKIHLLQRETRPQESAATNTGHSPSLPLFPSAPQAYPPCPLCDRPLDEHHWSLVLEHHQAEKKEILGQLWVLREQLTTSDREIEILRQEYRELDRELAHYGGILEQRGRLQEQLQGSIDVYQRMQQLATEQQELERALQTHAYAPELYDELQALDATLHHLHYDDRDHALARGEVDRWRWAELKQAEIKQAQRQLAHLMQRKPQLEAELADLDHQLTLMQTCQRQQDIDALTRQMSDINYHLEHHTAVREALRQAQSWQLRYQELLQAQQLYPQIEQHRLEIAEQLRERSHTAQTLVQQMESIQTLLAETPDCRAAIQSLEQQIQHRRLQLDDHLAQVGRLQQQSQHMEGLRQQKEEAEQQIHVLRRHYRVHQELSQAFSKNGIQALMIENLLPQLELETNRILGRLSDHQLHVQFVTQRAGRSKGSSRNAQKLIDTLDILINDAQGTRPYETYSGGEAFRVNFAIRLALARLLAQRSGTALQLLIVDEGFGTQDAEGCDRLIGAINAIAPDFSCILTVTHIPHLKEAFPTRIEIYKTEQGSQISLLV